MLGFWGLVFWSLGFSVSECRVYGLGLRNRDGLLLEGHLKGATATGGNQQVCVCRV